MSFPFRIGLGYDTHRLGNGGPLRIGGIDVASEVHAIGHSDADVLLHAITDALLGAIAEPDIGRLFSNTEASNFQRDSSDFLREAIRRVRRQRLEIGNLDAVILAEQPQMAPHIDAMRQRIAEILAISPGQIGLKAKTGEGVDAVGRGQAISVRAIVLLHSATP